MSHAHKQKSKSSEHRNRVLSASVGFAAILALYFGLGHAGVALITLAISSACYYEFLCFSRAAGNAPWVSMISGVALGIWLCFGLPGAELAFYFAALAVLFRGLWRVHHGDSDSLPREVIAVQSRVFGLAYLVFFPSFVPRIHALPHGPALLFLLIGIIWLGDIGAYYGGRAFGRRKLSPAVSPGKTMEGAFAALLACSVWAAAWGGYALPHIPVWKWVLISLLSSVVAQTGDLLESLLKRAYEVKDSGALIPGHGGVFDRFDSFILAAPFYFLLLRILT